MKFDFERGGGDIGITLSIRVSVYIFLVDSTPPKQILYTVEVYALRMCMKEDNLIEKTSREIIKWRKLYVLSRGIH